MGGLIEMLRGDCVSKILSFTSPTDAYRSSMVSSMFHSAAESDVVWEMFLPTDYKDVVSRLITPLTFTTKNELFVCLYNPVLIDGGRKLQVRGIIWQNIIQLSARELSMTWGNDPMQWSWKSIPQSSDKFATKKELFVCLCNPVLIDGGRKTFKLEKSSGKISYILSAKELSMTWGNDPMQWSWKSIPQSRFSEVAELKTTYWLEIRGKINTQILSSNTRYGAYLIMKISNRAYGLDSIPSEVSIEVGNKVCYGMAYLRHEDGMQQQMEYMFYRNGIEVLRKRVIEGTQRTSNEREDGWLEIELGEFFSGEANEEVKMSLMEVKGYQLKGGLVIEGIEVRPKGPKH